MTNIIEACGHPQIAQIGAEDQSGEALELLLIPVDGAGVARSANGDFKFGAEDAERVITAFEGHGVDLQIDYEHQSLYGEFTSPDGLARAAGWIKKLTYKAGLGLFGLVNWTPRARELIRGDEYRYLSPAVELEKDSRRVIRLVSVGLVNSPAMVRMPAVAARRDAASMETRTMPDTKTQVNQEEPTGGGDIGIIIGQICANLGIDPGEDLASTLRAIQEATKKGGGEEGESDAEEVAAKMRTALGLTVDATAETIVAEVNKLRGHIGYVKADEYKAVTKRLESLEQANAAREAEGLVATYIETGKLNPNDEERMKWAREQAVTNTEAFKTLMDGAPVIGPPQGKTTPPTGSAAGAGGRAAIIANSAREYDGMDTAYQVMTNKAAFVGGDLRKAGLKPLTAEETKALEG